MPTYQPTRLLRAVRYRPSARCYRPMGVLCAVRYRPEVLYWHSMWYYLRVCCALSGTDKAYAATPLYADE
eukprot:1541610-Rhodomonas_salina.1